MAKPKSVVQRGALSLDKDKERAKSANKGGERARTQADWMAQENAELPAPKRMADLINEAVGRDMFLAPGARAEWRDKQGRKFTTTRFYFTAPAVAFDKPATEKEAAMKAAYFAGTDIIYLPVMPMEDLTPAKLRAKLTKALAEKKTVAKVA